MIISRKITAKNMPCEREKKATFIPCFIRNKKQYVDLRLCTSTNKITLHKYNRILNRKRYSCLCNECRGVNISKKTTKNRQNLLRLLYYKTNDHFKKEFKRALHRDSFYMSFLKSDVDLEIGKKLMVDILEPTKITFRVE